MGRRGPKPTPTKVAAKRGTLRADRRGAEPEPPAGKPDCPKHLTAAARAEYDRICGALESMSILAVTDRAAIAACAVLWARWVEAEKHIEEEGPVIESPNCYPMQNPWLSIANQCLRLLKPFYHEFGLTPSARAGLKLPTEEKEDDLVAMIKQRYGTAPAE